MPWGYTMAHETSKSSDLVRLHDASKRGDTRATDALLRRLYPIVSRFLGRRLSDTGHYDDVIEDLTQEAVIRIELGLHRCCFADDPHLVAWCLRVARNAAVDELRRNSKRHERTLYVSELERLGPVAAQDLPPTERLTSNVRAVLNEILDSLDPTSTALLWARVVENGNWAEAAKEVGISESGAKRRWQRFQARFKRNWLEVQAHELSATDALRSR